MNKLSVKDPGSLTAFGSAAVLAKLPLCAPALLAHHLAAQLAAVTLDGRGGGRGRTEQAALCEMLEALRAREAMEDDGVCKEVVGCALDAVLGEGRPHEVDGLLSQVAPAVRREMWRTVLSPRQGQEGAPVAPPQTHSPHEIGIVHLLLEDTS